MEYDEFEKKILDLINKGSAGDLRSLYDEIYPADQGTQD